MFGFVVGTLCLIGLVKVLRHGHWAHHHHRQHMCGHGGSGCGGGGGWGRRYGGGWRGDGPGDGEGPVSMRSALASLDLSAEQMVAVKEAFKEFQASTKALRGEVEATRKDVARALRHPGFDEEALAEAFARHDDVLSELRKATVGALARVHAPLDERQRDALAELVEHAPLPWRSFNNVDGMPAFAA